MTATEALEKMGLSPEVETPIKVGKSCGIITYREIKDKDRIHRGKVYEGQILKGYQAEVLPGKYIKLFGTEYNRANDPVEFNKVFYIGDWAEYHSYNLKYQGKIIAIGEKTITIQSYPGTHNAENHKLSIYTFSWRNWDYDHETVNKYNAEEMMCI